MHFRYFTPLSGFVVLSPSASLCEVCDVSAHYLISGYSLYFFFFFSWAQCSHSIYWMLRDTTWFHCHILFLGSPPALWQRCGCGLLSHNSIRNVLKDYVLAMFILMLIAALRARVCELVLTLIRVYSFSDIIQITRQVNPLSWRLYIEMVGPIYLLFSLSSKGLDRGFVLLLFIWYVYVGYTFSILTLLKLYRWQTSSLQWRVPWVSTFLDLAASEWSNSPGMLSQTDLVLVITL